LTRKSGGCGRGLDLQSSAQISPYGDSGRSGLTTYRPASVSDGLDERMIPPQGRARGSPPTSITTCRNVRHKHCMDIREARHIHRGMRKRRHNHFDAFPSSSSRCSRCGNTIDDVQIDERRWPRPVLQIPASESESSFPCRNAHEHIIPCGKSMVTNPPRISFRVNRE
jgi:hypothetical protein